MSENPPDPDGDRTSSAPPGQDRPQPTRTMHWSLIAVPAVALLVGLVLGGLVVGVGSGGSSADPEDRETVTVSPSANSSDDTAVIVPRECIQAAETVQEATRRIRDELSAIRNFQASRIVDLLNELEDLTNQADEQARTCSDISVTPTSDAASPTS